MASGRVAGITVCVTVAALGLTAAGFSAAQARVLATRRPTRAELSAAAAAGVAQRWERAAAAAIFPATVRYTSGLQTTEKATRLAIGRGRVCAVALDATLRPAARADHCAAGVRATYTDALRGTVYTAGVLAFPDAADAAAFYGAVTVSAYPATGLNALPVAGTAAALFGDKARQAAAAQVAGPYVVLAVAGYADGRPALNSAERRDAVFHPGDSLVDDIAGRIARPVTAGCGTSEWACSQGDLPVPPPTFSEIRSYEMAMLGQIGVPDAWTASQGSGVTVAVLDTGVDPDAPDLTGGVTTGPDYTRGADPAGYQPPHEHGTYIASIIAGHGSGADDESGVVGVAPRARVLSVRVILDDGEPGMAKYNSRARYAKAIGRGIYYAVAHGAKVINMSLGSEQPTGYLRTAIGHALRSGVVVVASAGNSGTSGGYAPYVYPASFSGVIAVAAATDSGTRAAFSEQNAGVVLAAPGVGVLGDGPGGEYLDAEGTSPSAAIVSGVAALIKSRYPKLSPALVEQALITSTTHRPHAGYSVNTGFGEVDAAAALAAASRLAGAPAARGLSPAARFASAPGPIQVTHRDMALVAGYAGAAGGGLLCTLAALALLVFIARQQPRRRAAVGVGGITGTGIPDTATPDAEGARPPDLYGWLLIAERYRMPRKTSRPRRALTTRGRGSPPRSG
ncbi:MAG TPA: S8 family serine peptidase [Trebonia sp.]|nr:S8 family serine peptidase [Trebonia sp.]